jgi:hypothetical protein
VNMKTAKILTPILFFGFFSSNAFSYDLQTECRGGSVPFDLKTIELNSSTINTPKFILTSYCSTGEILIKRTAKTPKKVKLVYPFNIEVASCTESHSNSETHWQDECDVYKYGYRKVKDSIRLDFSNAKILADGEEEIFKLRMAADKFIIKGTVYYQDEQFVLTVTPINILGKYQYSITGFNLDAFAYYPRFVKFTKIN